MSWCSRVWTAWLSFTPSTLLPEAGFVGWRNYTAGDGDPELPRRLRQHRHLRHRLRRADQRAGAAAGDPARPARARRERASHDLPVSDGGLVRRHRHDLELAAQSRHRHPAAGAGLGLDQFPVRLAGRPRHGDLHAGDRRRLAGGRASPWRCSWPGCARSMARSSRRRRSTAPARGASTAAWCCRRWGRSCSR